MTNEITAEEAIKWLKDIERSFPEAYFGEWRKALRMAIQALEQQPSEEDFVNHKKEVLERIAKREREIDKYIKELEALEQQPSEDCVSRSELQKTMDSLPLFRFVNNDHEEADDYYNCESVDMVIRNLPPVTPSYNSIKTELKPCEDCISRQAVLDIITFEDKWLFDANGHNANTHIAFSSLESRVKALPSVTPERPKGKWIKIQSGDEDFPESIVCSRCKNENSHLDFDEHNNVIGKVFVTSKYCPNCGAEMSGGGEDEVSD